MSELGFKVPPTMRQYGDWTSVKSLIRKTGEAGDGSCNPWIDSPAYYPLHNCRSCARGGRIGMWAGRAFYIHVMAQIFKSGDLSNLIRSFDSISGGFLSNYFNAC